MGATGGPGVDVLSDREALFQADRFGLVAAVATAGAQVRAVSEQLAGLRIDRPRGLAVVGAGADHDAALLAALLPGSSVPVVAGEQLPGWVGPLDLVVVLASGSEDGAAAEAAAEAHRRGAALLVRGAARGPVADSAGTALVPPRIAVPELAAGPGRIAVLLAAAAAAGLTSGRAGQADPTTLADPATLADALDAEALACGPGAEPFVNPAVMLAQRLWDRTAVFLGAGPVGQALARRAARTVLLLGGTSATALPAAQLLAGGQLPARIGAPDDVFADPEFDEPGAGPGMVPVVMAPGEAGRPATLLRVLTSALPRATVLTPDEPGVGMADAIAGALQLALRVDFAAAYLGIAAGQVPPDDAPAGLGPAESARGARPAATVEDVMRDNWDDQYRLPWS